MGSPVLPTTQKKAPKNALLEARRLNNMLNDPFVKSQSDIGRELGISRARVNQFLALLNLPQKIQSFLADSIDDRLVRFFSERRLRKLLELENAADQISEFNRLKNLVR